MSTDRELLELAAKAAGIEGEIKKTFGGWPCLMRKNGHAWQPMHDDGDALRLAANLGISITPYPIYNDKARHSVIAKQRRHSDTLREANPTEVIELHDGDPAAAWRRAIARCAAEIGKAMS
jgi:hypothetical protein